MSKTISVKKDRKHCYNIQIRNSFSELPDLIKDLGFDKNTKLMLVSDSNVSSLYLNEVRALLEKEFPVIRDFIFEAGEKSKNLDTVSRLYEHLIKNRFERRDLILALGGGVVGDLTGFTAATYLRGVDFIQLPTSLLSQVDSSIGGKTGVDCMQYKNMVGAFYMPRLVYMNLDTLKTLPEREFHSGMAEIIKHGFIKDSSYLEWIRENHKSISDLDKDALEYLISVSCNIKRRVVEEDPTEKGERALLNFGHTIGHAIEKLYDFKLLHGECVSIGMAAAAALSVSLNKISSDDASLVADTLELFKLPTSVGSEFSVDEILSATKTDKKMEGGRVKFIVLDEIGSASINRDISDEKLGSAISSIIKAQEG